MSVKEKAQKTANFIAKAIKFFTTFIGQIVFYLIIILLVVLLVYIIVMVIAKDIAKILGWEGAISPNDQHADPFRDLTSSGYTQLLNADELVDYHAFEYAVLMDAARFMEETGTIMFGNEKASGDSGDPYFVFSDEAPFDLEMFTGNREMWAYLNAISLAENYISGGAGASLNSHINQAQYDADTAFNAAQEAAIQQAKAEYAAQQAANNAAGGGAGGNKDTSGEFNNDFINTAWFSGDHSKENLFYYTVENELTGSVSLIPYLEIPRNADTVTYYIEYRDNSSNDFLKEGIKFNLGNLDFVQSSRFEAPMNHANYGGLQYSYSFILEHLFPATICPELNANNTAAYATGDRNYGSNPNKIDLYKEYSESLFYGETGKITEHKIPLKILLDRFMPNASLLAAWQMLSDKDEAKNLVDEIQKTYSDACLTGEEYSGDKLLVKDVFTISATLDEDSKAMDIIDKVALKDASKEKYLNGDETLQLYYCYEALFDSRIWRTGSENAEEGSEEQNNESQNNNEQESQTPTAPVQKFEGGFSGDVIDDIKLVLTHFSENKSVGIQEDTYNRIINDAIKEIAPKESVPISSEDPNAKNGEYIIYTPIANGKYMVECQATRNNEQFRDHYNLDDGADISNKKKIMKEKDHIYNGNPYDAPEEIKECFVPFMKVAFTHKDGLRITAIIISYNDKYYGYIVKGKEIDDLSKITNVNTFAFFGSRDMQSVKPRHWVMAGNLGGAAEKSQEKWAVMDAFEGVGLSMGGISVTFKYTIAGEERTKTLSGSIADWCNYCGIDDDELIAQAFESYLGTFSGGNGANALISPGELAIIRTPDDPLSRNYEGLLNLPTNGSLSAEGMADYAYSANVGMSGGETGVIDKYYINLKALGYSEGEPFVLDSSAFSSVIRSKITSKINIEKLCNIAAYKPNLGLSSYKSVKYEDAQQYAAENQVIPSSSYDYSGGGLKIEDYSVVMPVRRFIIPITQEIWDKKMRFYLVGGAKSWSGVKKFRNHLTVKGEYKDRDNWIYIINSNPYCNGLSKYECTQKVNWRARVFAPIFAGKGEEATKTRETDVKLVLAEWLEAGENGISAADYYVRDLQDLLNFSKGIKSGDEWIVEPVNDSTKNKPYVNYDSYKYMYIPDEITQFDETIAEKAFWTDRLICTVDDDIEQPKENFLRSRAETFTWQIVDYDLYEECRNEDGTSSVYLLWMFGDQLSRTLYATAANCSDEEEKMVMSAWGGYSAVHRAADLYGRSQTKKIKKEIYPDGYEGEPLIKAEYNNGSVKLIGTDSTSGAGVMVGTNEEIYIDTPGDGLYRDNQPVTLILDGAEYKFNGTAAAAYGYELYRLTKVYKSAEKAEEYLKTQMEKEEKWTELRAVAPGIVSAVNCNATGGFVVHIQHANGTKSVYSHMKRYPLVQKGQYVGAGTLLGYEGTTGNSNGHHVHFSIDVPGISQAPSPVYYLYPFFSPFYYAEKAEEAGYELESDYMSISRTNFPYGQVAGANIPKEDDDLEARIQQMFNENDKFESGDNYPFAFKTDENTVMIKNYVPYRAFLKDSQLLYSENNDPENMLKDYSLPNKDDVRTVNKVSYAGEKLKVDPNYFDEEFQEYVKQNNNKITPGEGSGDSSATDESGDSNGSKDNENEGKPGTSGNETVGVNGTYSPSDFSQNKPKMDKNSYTDADFAKMEAELKARVEKAGFGTRAGVVEAALYLASLDYAVPYRGKPQEKENDIGFYAKYGLNRTWGKSVTNKRNQKGHTGTNGLDCTGFVEWAMVNGGVVANGGKPGGPSTNAYTKDEGSLSGRMKSALGYSQTRAHPISNVADKVEPGDIALSYGERNGTKCWTHVGLVVGVDANNIYIAEENTTTHLSGSEKSEGITVNKLVVTQVPKTYTGDRLGYIVLCDDTIYKAENSDGTGNKGNIPKVW